MRSDGGHVQVFDQRGQVLSLDVVRVGEASAAMARAGRSVSMAHCRFSLCGRPVTRLDDSTFEVRGTGQRLSTHPPLSGG